MSKTSKKPTLKYLLEWAKKNGYLYSSMENGKVSVFHLDGSTYITGRTLYSALYKAHKRWKDKK